MNDNASTKPKAPCWWHCDTHGPGNLNEWGCPNCVAELRRWKSTNATRLKALAKLLRAAQKEAHVAREAIATVASERAANALLTSKVRKAEAECNVLAWWMVGALGVLCDVAEDAEDGGESLRILKESGDRLVAAVFSRSQRPWEEPK